MPTARIATASASAVASADTMVLVADAQGTIRAPSLTPPQRRAVTQAGETVGQRPVTTLPGSVVGRAGTVVVTRDQGPSGPEGIRRAVGAALLGLDSAARVAVVCPDASPATVAAVTEGARLGAYRFTRYKSAPTCKRIDVVVPGEADRGQRDAVKRANIVADGVCLARDLVNTAPNDLGPADLAAVARAEAGKAGVAVKVWDDKALRRGGFGGLTAVGQGSTRGPRLIRLSYRPPGASTTVALIGKGITFDSGGLSLKPPKSMETMKCDMGGAAAVLAAVVTAARLKLRVAVTGWLAVAENMPSGTAQRPGDVITIRGGTTVEVLNTDAEGRLVLADAIVEAAGDGPDAMVDVATLTGAQMIALGNRVAGVMGNDDHQRTAVVAAGGDAGEMVWPMPLPEELRASLDSPIADLANIGDRNGGMLTAALFLREFVPEGLPWTHVDIAGPAFNEGAPHDYTPKGGTGFAVRTLVEFLGNRAEQQKRSSR